MFYSNLPKLQSMVHSLPAPVSNTAFNLPVPGLQAPVSSMTYNVPTALQAPVSNCAQSCPPTFVPYPTNSCHCSGYSSSTKIYFSHTTNLTTDSFFLKS